MTCLDGKGITNAMLKKSMTEHGVAIQTAEDFFEDRLYFRVNIACPKETLEKGVERILNCLEDLAK